MATKSATQNPPIHAALQNFDKLPDSAGARVPVVAALFGVSVPTVWRWSRDRRLPAPIKRGGVTLWNVGALRRVLAQTEPMPERSPERAPGRAPDRRPALRTARACAAAALKRQTRRAA